MNTVTFNRQTLLVPLQSVSGVVERRHTLPILSNVLISINETELCLTATDLEIQIECRVDTSSYENNHSVTVSARKLQEILKTLPEEGSLSLELVDKRLQLRSGKSKFNLQTLPAQDFPRMALHDQIAITLDIEQRKLKQLFSSVQFAMAQQDIRYYLNGLLLSIGEEGTTVVATDGHRLAVAKLPSVKAANASIEVIIPRKAVVELSRLLSDTDESVRLEILENQVSFRFGSIKLITKVVDGKFPDYQKVIPLGYKNHIEIDGSRLQQALQRAAILSNEKFRGIRWILTAGSLRIASTNSEQEEAEEEVEIEYSGDPLDMGFNVTYLLDVLSNVQPHAVKCSLGDANSSMLITLPTNPHFNYVIMPMRV